MFISLYNPTWDETVDLILHRLPTELRAPTSGLNEVRLLQTIKLINPSWCTCYGK